ncbi:nucleotidyltransferase domain-containing protein [Paenibacillus glycanilyticus]|uniref:nucleotidyltransferase domain-containing protein n=1 Tax=Paenibacillus glycanilyticus TaxID=126569 RepID=UPI00191064EB|nr:nucleotidyltransferase family protein [Paenibacillus glycanilyticus]
MSRPLDVSSFSKELKFMLNLLRSDCPIDAGEAIRQSKDLDWQSFLKLVTYHETFPVLYPLLVQLNEEQRWTPDFVMNKLKTVYSRNTFEMLHLRGEMERMNEKFADQGIRSLILKGPVLAAMLYGDISGRTSGDLDILVSKQDWDKCVKILLGEGYVRGEQYDESTEILNNTERKTHHISYIHPQKRIEIELHWRLNPDSVIEPTFEELWSRRQSSLLNKSVFTLGSEDLFVYLILHGTRHAWTSLRWLMDIDRMLSGFMNWNRVNQLFAASRSTRLGGKALILSTQLLGSLLPEEAYAMTLDPKAHRLAQLALIFIRQKVILFPEPESKEIAVAYNRYLLASMTFRQRQFYIWNKLYPSSKDVTVLHLPKSMHFLYFPLRPFLWFWRQVKRQTT